MMNSANMAKEYGRLFIGSKATLVVTDSGRVFSTSAGMFQEEKECDYSALHNVTAILNENLFRTWDDQLVNRLGEVVCEQADGLTRERLLPDDVGVVDSQGRVKINPDSQSVWKAVIAGESGDGSCWTQPLQRIACVQDIVLGGKAAIGLTKAGTLCFNTQEAHDGLWNSYHVLSRNEDGTLGSGIVDFFYSGSVLSAGLILLDEAGAVTLYRPNVNGGRQMASCEVRKIAFYNGSKMYLLDKFGMMRALDHVNEKHTTEWVCMKNCVDYYANSTDLVIMDGDGHVRYQEAAFFTGRRRREVTKWNTHY